MYKSPPPEGLDRSKSAEDRSKRFAEVTVVCASRGWLHREHVAIFDSVAAVAAAAITNLAQAHWACVQLPRIAIIFLVIPVYHVQALMVFSLGNPLTWLQFCFSICWSIDHVQQGCAPCMETLSGSTNETSFTLTSLTLPNSRLSSTERHAILLINSSRDFTYIEMGNCCSRSEGALCSFLLHLRG